MNRLILSFITLYLLSAESFCVDNMKFSDDDLKNFSMKTNPQKARNVIRLDQRSDVVYFESEEPYKKSFVIKKIKELSNSSDPNDLLEFWGKIMNNNGLDGQTIMDTDKEMNSLADKRASEKINDKICVSKMLELLMGIYQK